MSTYRLEKLFAPRSVAVVGASPRPTSPGRAVLHNLRSGGFPGSISFVNPRYDEIEGVRSVRTVQELPEVPDLMVIAAPAQSVPGIVAAAGEKGAATAIIITAGLGHGTGTTRRGLRKGRPRHRPQTGRPESSRHPGAARQAQCQLRRPHAAGRRSRSCVAVRRDHRRLDRMVGNARHRFLGSVFRWATKSTSTSPTCSTSSRSIAPPERSCSTSNRSTMRASSCQRRAPQPGSSQSW